MAGYSGTPLAKKLGIKDGHCIGVFRGPTGFLDTLDLPPSVRIDGGFDVEKSYDVIVAFLPDLDSLGGTVERFRELIKWDGGLWLSWPKRSSPLATDIRESDVRTAGLEGGLVDNKICAVDADWSGLRFVYRREDRPG